VQASIALDHASYSIAAGPEGVWVLAADGHVTHIDPTTDKVIADIEVPASEFGSVAVGARAVWVTSFDHDALIRIDPATNKVVATITVGTNPEGILVTPTTVWVANHRGGSITKVDPATNKVTDTFTFAQTGTSGPKGIVVADKDVWTTVPNSLGLFRLDADTGSLVKKISILADDMDSPMTDGTSIYVPTTNSFKDGVLTPGQSISRIDPATNTIVQQLSPKAIPWLFARSAFWVPSGQDLDRLDPTTLEPAKSWPLAPPSAKPLDVTGMAFDDDAAWLIIGGRTVIRVQADS